MLRLSSSKSLPDSARRCLAALALATGLWLAGLALGPVASSPATTLMVEDGRVLGDKKAGDAMAEHGYTVAGFLGAQMIRFHRGWQEGAIPHLDRTWEEVTETWVDDVVRRGFEPYLTITYQPDSYDFNPGVVPFGDHCQRTAERFAGRVTHYSVWNEPNTGGGEQEGIFGGQMLRDDPGYYNELYRECYERIKAVSAANKVYYGEIDAHVEGACDWVADSLDGGPTTFADGIAIHTYQWTLPPEQKLPGDCQGIGRLGDWKRRLEGWEALRTPAGGPVPILVTEHGYCAPLGECPPGFAGQFANRVYDENLRADLARRAFFVAQSQGVEVFSYFHLFNQPDDNPGTAGPDDIWDSGIVGLDGTSTPSVPWLRMTVLGQWAPPPPAPAPAPVAPPAATGR